MRTMTKQQMNLLVDSLRARTDGDYVHEYANESRIDIANEEDSYYFVWRLVPLNGEDTWVQTYAWDAWVDDHSDGFDPEADALLADLACASEHEDAQPTRERVGWNERDIGCRKAARYGQTHYRKPQRPKGAARISQFLNCEEGD